MAQRKSGYDRRPHELYETPEWVTETLFDNVDFSRASWIWEPAMGSGKMLNVISKYYPQKVVFGSDLNMDFLKVDPKAWQADCIITNPPFNLAEKFLIKALKLTRANNGMVAMLLRVDFDSAKTRYDIFDMNPAWAKKIVLMKRIKWFEHPDKKKTGPSENHAWYIFDWTRLSLSDPVPEIIYAPREYAYDTKEYRDACANHRLRAECGISETY